jgi:hypothetical protein
MTLQALTQSGQRALVAPLSLVLGGRDTAEDLALAERFGRPSVLTGLL